jgi:hypothetical protein
MTRLLLLCYLFACTPVSSLGPSGGVGNGGVEPVVGQYCTQTDTVYQAGGDWHVTVYLNVTTTRYVPGSDGIVRVQQVRSCKIAHCLFLGYASLGYSASWVVATCRELHS